MRDESPVSATWTSAASRLDVVLAELGLARSRSRAAELVARGDVVVDGRAAQKAGQKVLQGQQVSVTRPERYVSRGAEKLLAALDGFEIDVSGRTALDLGASTGGFTQVLLERGAAAVLAIDVGHDQMVPLLAEDPRVRLVEGCNARDLTAAQLARDTGIADPPSLVVADLSFISLRYILPAISRCLAGDRAGRQSAGERDADEYRAEEDRADIVLLIKPQFEVGRVRDGIVTDPAQWASAIRSVLDAAADEGLTPHGLAPSPIEGGHGNREFLVHFVRDPRPNPTEWETRIEELCAAPPHRTSTNDPGKDDA